MNRPIPPRLGGQGPDGLVMFGGTAPTKSNLPFIKSEGSSDEPIDTSEDGCPRARRWVTDGRQQDVPMPPIKFSMVLVDPLKSVQ